MPRREKAKSTRRYPFRRLDEPAWSWTGDVASLAKHLLRREERERCKRDVAEIMANPEHAREAIRQLRDKQEQIKGWEKQPDRFMREERFFVIERILLQLEAVAQNTTLYTWPELLEIIEEYRQMARRTAGVRFSAVRSVFESP